MGNAYQVAVLKQGENQLDNRLLQLRVCSGQAVLEAPQHTQNKGRSSVVELETTSLAQAQVGGRPAVGVMTLSPVVVGEAGR